MAVKFLETWSEMVLSGWGFHKNVSRETFFSSVRTKRECPGGAAGSLLSDRWIVGSDSFSKLPRPSIGRRHRHATAPDGRG